MPTFSRQVLPALLALLVLLLHASSPVQAEEFPRLGKVRVAFSPRGDALDLILDELRAANQRIDVAMFYLSNDTLVDALCHIASRNRVSVTVYVDGEMDSPSHRPALERLRGHGAAVYLEDPDGGGTLHFKTAVIDGKKVLTGSSNWTKTAFTQNCEDSVVIESPALAAHYLARFEQLRETCTPLGDASSERADAPDTYPSAPRVSRDRRQSRLVAPRTAAFHDVRGGEAFLTPGRAGLERLIQRISQASRSVDVAIYSLSDPEVLAALTRAAGTRGVRVRIIVDDRMISGGRLRDLQQLHDAGAQVTYLENDTASLHLKSAVIDERVVVFGSHNWTPSAAASNTEDLLMLDSRRMARHYLDYFEYIIDHHAKPFTTIERDRVARSDDGAPLPTGLRKAGSIHYPDSLPATGPRARFDDLSTKRPTEPIHTEASLAYLDDGDYLPVLRDLIRTANQSILVSLYHVAPGERSAQVREILDALGDAAGRGRYVYLVLNMPENPSDSQQAYHSGIAEDLRQRGVDVRLCVPGIQLHEKVVVVDLAKILIGSHNWSEGALTGEGVYESSALLVLPRQDPRFAEHILRHPVVRDMRDRQRWENELALLRHIASLRGDAREAFIQRLEAER